MSTFGSFESPEARAIDIWSRQSRGVYLEADDGTCGGLANQASHLVLGKKGHLAAIFSSFEWHRCMELADHLADDRVFKVFALSPIAQSSTVCSRTLNTLH